jgi:ribosomal protein L11 methyltransferase
MVYIQYEFFTRDDDQRAFLMALLAEFGFDGFEELRDSVKAFIPQSEWDHDNVLDILKQNNLEEVECQYTTIQPRNWNEEWEKSFDPLLIAERVSIRAPFHEPVPAEFELIIEPKMSFGTGHHPTTSLMIQQMLSTNFQGKEVLDFGSGTGVLAILAEKLGALRILAVDNEEWAIENCHENIERNNVSHISVLHADNTNVVKDKYDIILANINRNVILKYLTAWHELLFPGALLIISGILVTDESDINQEAEKLFTITRTLRLDGWVCISYTRK